MLPIMFIQFVLNSWIKYIVSILNPTDAQFGYFLSEETGIYVGFIHFSDGIRPPQSVK